MAITAQDYKFIHNTLPKGSGRQDNGELKLGATVENLVVDLSLKNITNRGYPEYYNVNKPLTEVWYPPYKVEEYEMTESVTVYVDKYEFEFSYDGKIYITDVTGNFLNKYNYYYDQSSNKTFLEVEFDDEALLEEGLGEEELRSFKINLLIKYEKRLSENEKTISAGELHTKVSLKPNTTYVLQVVNAVMPSVNSKPESKLICSNQTWEFENYLFFKTPKTQTDLTYTLQIQGISFGYAVIGVDDATGAEVALRCFASDEKPKVFLFKTDIPWIVNDKGVIISSSTDTTMGFEIDETTKPISLDLSESQARTMFSLYAPSISVIQEEGKINPSLLIQIHENAWSEYGPGWRAAYKNTANSAWSTNFKLLVFRDYLAEDGDERPWNNRYITQRYGIVRTIQDHKKNSDFKISTQLPSVTDEIKFIWGEASRVSYAFDSSTLKTEAITLNLPLVGAYLGYNKTYERSKWIVGDKSKKYTSIAFAWGFQKPNGMIERISPITVPIIIDRSIFENSKTTSEYVIEQKKNYSINKCLNGEGIDYYTDASYQIMAK